MIDPADVFRPFEAGGPLPTIGVDSLVRVKLSPECFCWGIRRWDLARPPVDRHIGVVTKIFPETPESTSQWKEHRYWVEFLKPYPRSKRNGNLYGGAFCGVELEPYFHWSNDKEPAS